MKICDVKGCGLKAEKYISFGTFEADANLDLCTKHWEDAKSAVKDFME